PGLSTRGRGRGRAWRRPPMSAKVTSLYQLGDRVLGPALAYYIYSVIRRGEELSLDRLYFVAREGHLLLQIHERVEEQLLTERRPACHYVHLSRLSTSLPSVWGFGEREVRLG